MNDGVHDENREKPRAERFPSTCWSRLIGSTDPEGARAALATLAHDYFEPVVAYLRAARRIDRERALDLAQGFFEHVLENGWLNRVDPARGSFRKFLKQSLRNFANDVARRDLAAMRGGGRHASVSDLGDLAVDPGPAPEAELDSRWRRELVAAALAEVRNEFVVSGRATTFAAFEAYFLAADDAVDHRAVGVRLGLTPSEVSNALQAAKKSFRAKLRARVAHTVSSVEELETELAWLFGRPA